MKLQLFEKQTLELRIISTLKIGKIYSVAPYVAKIVVCSEPDLDKFQIWVQKYSEEYVRKEITNIAFDFFSDQQKNCHIFYIGMVSFPHELMQHVFS